MLNEIVNNLLENFFNDENWSLGKTSNSSSKKLHFYNLNNDIAVIHYYFSDLKVSNKVIITHQAKLITIIHFYMLLKNNLGILFGYNEEKIGTLWLTSKKYFDNLRPLVFMCGVQLSFFMWQTCAQNLPNRYRLYFDIGNNWSSN